MYRYGNTKQMNLKDILEKLSIPAVYYGDQTFDAMGKIEACVEGRLCAYLNSAKYIDAISKNIHVIITTKESSAALSGYNTCIVDYPKVVFFMVHNLLANDISYKRPPFTTQIGRGCCISNLAMIADSNIYIGENVIVEEFVSIKENTTIGNNSIIRAGTVIGSEGFQYARMPDSMIPIRHIGGVIIGKHVEVQANATIDKAIYPWDDSVVLDHSKIGGSVHIDHAVKIGQRTLVAGSSLIAGNSVLGNDVWIGSNATIRNSISIGDNARINMGAVVTKDVAAGDSVSGNFAIDHSTFIEHIKYISNLYKNENPAD